LRIPTPTAGRTQLQPRVAITIDLHESDSPSDITYAANWLAGVGIAATFFVPSAMFDYAKYAERLKDLHDYGHEVGSHTHNHDWTETQALIEGPRERLGFLRVSKSTFEDFYGRSPRSFRSPGWCVLGPAALDELETLGYTVDSSATPQRLSILSSLPYHGAYTLAPRRVRRIRPGLLEVPTSTLLVPAASPTFLIFRHMLSLAFVRMLLLEATALMGRVLTLQFHPEDFSPVAPACTSRSSLRLEDFWLRRYGGLTFKHKLKCNQRAQIVRTTRAIIDLVGKQRHSTLAAIAAEWAI